jgi:Helix-turn-helix of DDE superfamily endonuclease
VTSNSSRITDTGPSYLKFGALDLPRRRGVTTSPLIAVAVSVHAAAMAIMKPSPTDIHPLPHCWRNLVPLTGLTVGQVYTVCAQARHRISPHPGRPWGLPLTVTVLLVLIHLHTNLTRALAARFDTSQSTVDRIIHHLVPVLTSTLRPDTDPGARSVDHRHQQQLPAQPQHPDHHLRSPAPRGRRRPLLAR